MLELKVYDSSSHHTVKVEVAETHTLAQLKEHVLAQHPAHPPVASQRVRSSASFRYDVQRRWHLEDAPFVLAKLTRDTVTPWLHPWPVAAR